MINMSSTLEPIAVIGISCRFPGGANSPAELWEMLAEGREGWSKVPKDRFEEDSFHHPSSDAQNSHNHRGGYFLDQNIAAFDASFFDIPRLESEIIDPQHRIQLEVAYEAFENAGIPSEDLSGSNTGVYIATFSQDYINMQYKDLDDLNKYHMTGTGHAIASNRISYTWDLRGPSVSLDTGCSGSLVAIHQACQSLRLRECTTALAGASNLILNPDMMIPMSLLHVLNDTGKCYSYDARGSGYGRGEGAAMVVLKRLSDAIANGDHIRAIVQNTGVGQDGKTPGIMVPNRYAQQSLALSVYQQVGLDPVDTVYIEGHGTGTVVGDAEEIAAIRGAFGGDTRREIPIHVTSIKPNVGHLESASGIAGFIKAILMLEHKQIPPNLNLDIPKDCLKDSGIVIPRSLMPWREGALHRVSINSFGYGGTNAHAILDAAKIMEKKPIQAPLHEYHVQNDVLGDQIKHNTKLNGCGISERSSKQSNVPTYEEPPSSLVNGYHSTSSSEREISCPTQVLTITAKSETSLLKSLENLRGWISKNLDANEDTWYNIAHTLSTRRSLMQWRCAFSASTLLDALRSLSSNNLHYIKAPKKSEIVFVFAGQGAQWFAMGRELMKSKSVYLDSLEASDKHLRDIGASWSLIHELSQEKNDSRINDSEIAQPTTTAIQLALVDLLASIGIKPEIVLGHSSGEIAAAYAAGFLDQTSALKVAFFRGQAFMSSKLAKKGAMLAVGLGEVEASKYLSGIECGDAVIACLNSPVSTTISGDEEAIIELETKFKAESITATRLKVDIAYHSDHVKPVTEVYRRHLTNLSNKCSSSGPKFFSTVTGKAESGPLDPEYWVDNLVFKVKFQQALESVCHTHFRFVGASPYQSKAVFLEIGPHSVLSGAIRQSVKHIGLPAGFSTYSVLYRNRNSSDTFFDVAGSLFQEACQVDIGVVNMLFRPKKKVSVVHNLPSYPWDHSNLYWHESRLSKSHRLRPHPYHDLLGTRAEISTSIMPIWRHILSIDRIPWLEEHKVDGVCVFPASAYLCMVIEAARQMQKKVNKSSEATGFTLKDIFFTSPLLIPDSPGTVEIQLILTLPEVSKERGSPQWAIFRIVSVAPDSSALEHCRGQILTGVLMESDEVEASREKETLRKAQSNLLSRLQGTCTGVVGSSELYRTLESRGNYYGPNFARVQHLLKDENNVLATVVIPHVASCMPSGFQQPHIIHPTTLDAFMHATLPVFNEDFSSASSVITEISELHVPARMPNLPGTSLLVAATTNRESLATSTADLVVFEKNDALTTEALLYMKGAKAQASLRQLSEPRAAQRDMSYKVKWGLDAEHVTKAAFEQNLHGIDQQASVKLQSLNRAAAIYVSRCVEELTKQGHQNLSGHYQHQFRWMKKFCISDEYKSLMGIESQNTVDLNLMKAHKLGVEGKLLSKVGKKLPSILTGDIGPLDLMMDEDLLYQLYNDDSSSRCYAHLQRHLKHLAFKNPNMAVLEVGAGTGSATVPVLQSFASNDSENPLLLRSYDFTDISSGFFERSRSRLMEWDSFIRYRKLNLDIDPVSQGFDVCTYDLVIAANCIHASASISSTLAGIRKLLKPGGRLLMIEVTRTIPFYNTCLGILPGWWAGVEDGRTDSPVLTVDKWNSSLLSNNFNGIEIALHDYEGDAQRSSLLVSKALDTGKGTPIKLSLKLIICPHWEERVPKFISNFESILQTFGFDVIREKFSSVEYFPDDLYLVFDDGSRPILAQETDSLFNGVTQLMTKASKILWVTVQEDSTATQNAQRGLITGFGRVARAENQSLKLILLDVRDHINVSCTELTHKTCEIIKQSFIGHPGSSELEYIFQDGQLYIPRLVPDPELNLKIHQGDYQSQIQRSSLSAGARKLNVQKPGFLDTLEFIIDDSISAPLPSTHIEVEVAACGVNFKDVLIALGHVKRRMKMAGEFAGTVTRVGTDMQDRIRIGDRVCGFGATAYASNIRVNGLTVCVLPKSMSFDQGAAVPVIFCTAYHGLVDIAQLKKGQSVLVHSAAGGVGQAALKISQYLGAEIFATVGNAAKKSLLIEKYGIPEDHIFSSKLTTFRQGILRLTKGAGVDVIMNSLSGSALHESWACLAPFGTFVELGKTDALSQGVLSMEPFDRNVNFASVDLQLLVDHRPKQTGELLSNVMSLLTAGVFTPVEPVTMPITMIENAFRTMQSRNHTGKIVLTFESRVETMTLSSPDTLKLVEHGTYLIAGGLGGLGIEIAKLFANRGAQHIVLLTRRRIDYAGLTKIHEEFSPYNVNVRVLTCDITNFANVQESISICVQDLPPVKGVIQATVVLQDRVLSEMTLADFHAATRPKCEGTLNLIQALQDQQIDFFLMLSSISGIIGGLSAANYAAGSVFMDTLATMKSGTRPQLISLDLGVVEDAGIVKENTKFLRILGRQGLIVLKKQDLLATIEHSLSPASKVDECKQIVIGIDYQSLNESDNQRLLDNPMFTHLLRYKSKQQSGNVGSNKFSIESSIAAAVDLDEVEAIISKVTAKKIARLVAVEYDEIDRQRRLIELGLDSLVVLELKNWLEQSFKAKIQTPEIMNAMSISSLARLVAEKSNLLFNNKFL